MIARSSMSCQAQGHKLTVVVLAYAIVLIRAMLLILTYAMLLNRYVKDNTATQGQYVMFS